MDSILSIRIYGQKSAQILLGIFALFVFYTPPAHAQSDTSVAQHFTLDGRLFIPGSDSEPLLDNGAGLLIQVLNPAKDCILYEEEQVVNTLGTNGYFTVRVGSALSATKRTTRDSNNSMNTVFYNTATLINGRTQANGACAYDPDPGAERFFRFYVKPTTSGAYVQMSDDMAINSVPQAIVAQTLQGLAPADVFKTSVTSTQAKLDNLLTTEYNEITDLISGASPLYLPNDPAGTVFQSRTADPVAPAAGQVWFNSSDNKFKYFDGATTVDVTSGAGTGTVTSIIAGAGLSGGTISTTGTIAIADSGVTTVKLDDASVTEVKLAVYSVSTSKLIDANVTNAKLATGIDASKVTVGTLPAGVVPTGTDDTKLPLIGGTMTGIIQMGDETNFAGFDLLNSGHITMNGQKTITIGRYDSTQQTTLIGSLSPVNAGALWFNTTTGKLMFWSGSQEYEISETTGAGGDITAVNTNAGSGLSGGATSGPVTLAINVDGTSIAIATNTLQIADGGVNTAKLADLSVSTGKLADANVTEAKLSDGAVTSAKIADGTIVSADVDTISVAKISSAAAEYFSYMPAGTECNAGEVLKWNAVDNRWLCDTDLVGATTHAGLADLGADDHAQYALLAGRAGGQNYRGGTAASENLTLESTSHATKGFVLLQPTGGNVGIGTTSPDQPLHVFGNTFLEGGRLGIDVEIPQNKLHVRANGFYQMRLESGDAGGGYWNIGQTDNSFSSGGGKLLFVPDSINASLATVAFTNSGNVGIGTNNPASRLDVSGTIRANEICDEAGTNCKDISTGWGAGGDIDGVETNAGSGLAGGATSGTATLSVVTDNTTIEVNGSNALIVKDGGISTAKLGDASVSTNKLIDANVTEAKLADGAVTSNKLANTSVSEAKLADGAVATNKLANIAVTEAKLADSAVSTSKLANTSVTEGKLADSSVTSAKIADGTIVSADVDNISIGKISSVAAEYFSYMPAGTECNTGEVLKWNATNDRWLCDTDAVGASSHSALTDLGADDHSQYALLAGRAGGQNYRGGTAASENLTLESTSNTTKGFVLLQPTGGNVGIGTTTPSARLHVVGGSVLATGNTGATPVSGTGTRLMWIPAKAAFRAGAVANTEWDDANVGTHSVAMGYSTRASNSGSIALGYHEGSSAHYIVSSGKGALAGGYAFASTPTTSTIQSTNDGSFAYGRTNRNGTITASGYGALALGHASAGVDLGDQALIQSSGNGSVATGYALADGKIIASGSGAVAMGYANDGVLQATGAGSVALGEMVQATANNAMALGKGFTNSNADTLSIGFAATPTFTVAGGDVGIGTTLPTAKLEVAGTIKATAFEGPLTSSVTSSGAGTNLLPSLTFTGDPDTGFYNTNSDNILSVATGGTKIFDFTSNGLTSPTTGGGLIKTANGDASTPTFSFSGDPDTGWFRAADNTLAASTGGAERMRINSSGNVGIGTTAPATKLQVVGEVRASNFSDTQGSYNVNLGNANVEGRGITAGFSGSSYAGIGYNVRHTGTTGEYTAPVSDTASYLLFHHGGFSFMSEPTGASGRTLAMTTHMRIDSTGNVGIGTTSPTSKLHIDNGAGSSRVSLTNSTTGATATDGIILGVDTGGSAAYVWNYENDSLYFGTNNAEAMRILPSGNVGIGTTAPSARLDVASGTTGGTMVSRFWAPSMNNATTVGISVGKQAATYDNAALYYTHVGDGSTSNRLGLGFHGTQDFISVLGSGNVGIGTTVPAARLDVRGNIQTRIDNANVGGYVEISNGAKPTGSAQSWRIYNMGGAYGNSMQFWVYDDITGLGCSGGLCSGPVTFTDTGSVGIGTSIPGYKLDVQGGDINASGSVRSAGIALTSDVRYKSDIATLDNSLDKLLHIRGVSYSWRTEEFPEKHFSERPQVGVIAQEVEAQFPEVVDTNKDGYKSVNYPALVAPIIEAVKSLYYRVVGVEKNLSQHGRELASLKSQKTDKSETAALRAELKRRDQKIKELERRDTEMRARLDRIEKLLQSK